MTRFLQTCTEPDCGELVRSGRCPKHLKARAKIVRQRSLDWNWVYATRRWKGLRRQVIQEQPWCGCGEPDCFELSAEVDHIVAMQDGGAPFDRANLRGLARACHARKTQAEVMARKGIA